MTATPDSATPSAAAASALQVAGEYQKRALDPVDRFSEILFGLIMVLTFTGTLSVAESGRQEVREMLVAALACNVAWGLVDGVMYAVTSVAGRARRALVLQGIRAADPAAARTLAMTAMPEGLAAFFDEGEADRLVARIRALPAPQRRPAITLADLRGAFASCLLVLLATFPPTIPFLLVQDTERALRISNAVAVACMFLAGYALGRSTGMRAWLLGFLMVFLGSALVGLTIALGG